MMMTTMMEQPEQVGGLFWFLKGGAAGVVGQGGVWGAGRPVQDRHLAFPSFLGVWTSQFCPD